MQEKQIDRRIIELYFARNEEAIVETAHYYGPFCLQVSLGILRNRADAEECVNDTYVKTWNSIPPTRPQSLKAYLARIVRNLSIDRIKADRAAKRSHEVTLALEELSECLPVDMHGNPYGSADALTQALPSLLNQFLRSLATDEWQLFCGRYWHNRSVKELAREHGLTPKAVTMRLSRTREKLRIFIQERGFTI